MGNNSKILSEIAQKENLVVFAGAGIPTASGIPVWKELLRQLHYHVGKQCSKTDMEEWNSSDYPDIAQKIYMEFQKLYNDKSKAESEYLRSIERALKPTVWPYSACQMNIVHTFDQIVTTNFDTTFDEAINDYNHFRERYSNKTLLRYVFPKGPSKRELYNPSKKMIYLHGYLTDSIIFKTEDYEKYYKADDDKKEATNTSTRLKEIYTSLYEDFTILFIGFSFDDTYIKEMLENVYCTIKNNYSVDASFLHAKDLNLNIQHYAFMMDVDVEQKRQLTEYEREYPKYSKEYKEREKEANVKIRDFKKCCMELNEINIKVVKYNNHSEYRGWLNTIKEERVKFDKIRPSRNAKVYTYDGGINP